MDMEIGSIYELDPGLLRGARTESTGRLNLREVEKYNKKYIRYTASGREAIALALKSFEQKHPAGLKRCLLPAYMCDSVFFPFEHAGWELHFYHLDRKMEADVDELNKLIGQIRPTLIFIHPYYGVDTWKSSRPFFREWRKQGICIMEDVTQSYYLENAGMEADYCVGSLRKWYAVPDGGFVALDEELPGDELALDEEFARKKEKLLQDKWEYLHGQMEHEKRQALKAEYLRKNRETESWLDEHTRINAMSEDTAYILSGINEKECESRRKENSRYLHEHLGGRTQIVPVFDRECAAEKTEGALGDKLSGGSVWDAAPLYYPVYAKDRDDLQKYLALRGVYAPTLWPVGTENEDVLSQEERYIYEHILALPIDQRYGTQEMKRVVEVLDQYEAEKSGKHAGIGRWMESLESTDAKGQAECEKTVDTGEETERRRREEQKLIGIRVDANDTVATGHVMRCITIARKLMQAGSRVIFYTADEYAGEMLEQTGLQYVCLHSKWDDMEQEIPLLRKELERAGCDKLLIDSYQVTGKYFEGLHDLCKLIYIDDCFEEIYPVNMIINYNAYHVRFPYKSAYAGKAKLLLGTSYAPLREEFGDGDDGGTNASSCHDSYSGTAADLASCSEMSQDIDEAPHILLSSGGGDMYNAMAGILREAMKDGLLRLAVFHVVVGGFNRNVEELRRLAEGNPNICLHERVEHMAKLMSICTAAVSAAGTMLFELSAMQVPTVFFVSADNQQYDHEFFAQDGRMLYAGDIRTDRDECLEKICGQLRHLLEDGDMREAMKRKLHEVTDGNGAQRIATEILRL